MPKANIERCPTGIPGFDALCDGGLVKGSVNAILGGPGAGKTTFLLQFLHSGVVDYRENGLFIHFEVDPIELFKDGQTFGWDFQKLESQNVCKFMQFPPDIEVRDLKGELARLVSKYDIRRICFDPISLFKATEEKNARIRQGIYDFTSLLKRMHVTVLLSTESTIDLDEGNAPYDIRAQYVKFLSDGLITLHSSGLGGISDRAIQIVKMRRTNHIRGPIPLEISPDGLKVLYAPDKRGRY